MDPSGERVVLVSADALGFSTSLSDKISAQISRRSGIPRDRIFLSATHSHAAPVMEGVLPLIYKLPRPQRGVVRAYTADFIEAVLEAAAEALERMRPASLQFRQGVAGMGVNRRRCAPGSRHLPGPVDPDVPVLSIRDSDKRLRGVLFGYACHATALADYQISGDYAGFACHDIEKAHPGAMALFFPGCGGDINPLPRRTVARAKMYGSLLSEAVLDQLSQQGRTLKGPLRARQETVALPYDRAPTLTRLKRQLASRESADKWVRRVTEQVPPEQRLAPEQALAIAEAGLKERRERIQRHIRRITQGHSLPKYYQLPLGILDFGPELRWIHIGGEPVVDYSLILKERWGWETTWVSGYLRDLGAYIPSLRVLREGGYEGEDAMWEYGHPSRFGEGTEDRILTKIQDLLRNRQISS